MSGVFQILNAFAQFGWCEGGLWQSAHFSPTKDRAMSLLGSAALAMWWDVAGDVQPEFEDWHTHEHIPERLGIPGFYRASRWRSRCDDGGMFVMYELANHDVLSSPHYLKRLNAPTAWSTRMMPHHRRMVRSQCRVLESRGAGTAGHALTVRLAPAEGHDAQLHDALRSTIERLVTCRGISGAHLLRHQRPEIDATTEQKMRGGDREADWILLVVGYDARALEQIAFVEAGASVLDSGAAAGAVAGVYSLSTSATPADIA
jgi:hypothetical protein